MNEEKKRVVAILDADKSNSCDVYVLDKRKHFSTVQGKGTGQLPFDVMTNRLTFYTPSEQSVIRENLTTEQGSNYGEFAGIKTAEEFQRKIVHDVLSFNGSQDVAAPSVKHYYETGHVSGTLFLNIKEAMNEFANYKQVQTLNAVRGIIVAADLGSYSNKIALLNEINKLQP